MRLIFSILLMLLCNIIYSQNLSFEEISKLRKKNFTEVEEFLASKNWILIASNMDVSKELDNVVFAYKKSIINDEAESFLTYHFTEHSSKRKRVAVQIHNIEIYKNYLSKIKSYGCKLINSSVEEEQIKKVYQGATTTFIITVSTTKNTDSFVTAPKYGFFIVDNSDYYENFND